MTDDVAKKSAGAMASELVTPGMRLGLGTGSTVSYFLSSLASRGLDDVAGLPTSRDTEQKCKELGIRLLEPHEVTSLDLCIDGADELDVQLSCTKGGGGALLREKVVASMSDSMIIIATEDKLVERLGDTFAIPIEVVTFALTWVLSRLEELGCSCRVRGDGKYLTDNQNSIIDARIEGGIEDPAAFEAQVLMIPGVAECGIFTDLATTALLGRPDGSVRRIEV